MYEILQIYYEKQVKEKKNSENFLNVKYPLLKIDKRLHAFVITTYY